MSMLTNFQLKPEDFMLKFDAAKFNMSMELQGIQAADMIDRVVNKINDELFQNTKRDVRTQKTKQVFHKADKAIESPLDVLKLIEEMR
jgi:hypothetical protein